MILICNKKEYSSNYPKTSANLWLYHKDYPNNNITDSESFKFKGRITGRTPPAGNTKDVQIDLSFKYLSNLWMTLEMSVIRD